MKVYAIFRDSDHRVAVTVGVTNEPVRTEDGSLKVQMRSYKLNHYVRHSPDGFECGYGGSGPADLAFSILVDLLGLGHASVFYQNFKWAFIAPIQELPATIREDEIQRWLRDGAGEKR